MVEWIIPMIAGLLLDCIGAFLLVKPLLFLMKQGTTNTKRIENLQEIRRLIRREINLQKTLPEIIEETDVKKIPTLDTKEKRLESLTNLYKFLLEQDFENNIEESQINIRHNKLIKSNVGWGIGFLLSGFILVMIGNILQWINL